MTNFELNYLGEMKSVAIHGKNGTEIFMDAPEDNNGKAEHFSPTDMVATALGGCILTTIGILTEQKRLPELEMSAKVRKHMTEDKPRRIGKIEIDITIKDPGLTDKQKELIERITHKCPVSNSLHPDLLKEVTLTYVQ